ncbi:MAG: archaellin/type IV pilin N-terminal domain-containing protein, partial [Candidatus Methanomethylicaceae archaeon]
MRLNRKGVSPIIATLLLIVITVAAAVVTYTFVMTFVGSGTQTQTVTGKLSYDSYKVDGTTDANITAYIRNVGGTSVLINSVYVDGTAYTFSNNSITATDSGNWTVVDAINATSANAIIDPNAVKILFINTNNLNAAQWHTVRMVCTDGTILEFSVRKQ